MINIEINREDRYFNINEIPLISSATSSLSSKIKNIQFPGCFHKKCPIDQEIQTIGDIEKSLKETQDQVLRNQLIALLKTTLLIMFVAGSIVACVYGGSIGLALGMPTAILGPSLLSVYFYQQAKESIQKIEQQIPGYVRPWYFPGWQPDVPIQPELLLALCGGGLIMPLFEAYTRTSRLERLLHSKQTQHKQTVTGYQQQLAEGFQLAQTRLPEFLQTLQTEIEKCQSSLNIMRQCSARSVLGEHDLESQISQYQNAQTEVRAILEFYQKQKEA